MRKGLSLKRLFKEANSAFLNGDYKKAIFYYSLILKQEPENKEAKIGILLSDLAQDESDEAIALYDYYQVLKKEKKSVAENIIEEMINSHDLTVEKISKFLEDEITEIEDGITYSDFKKHIENRGSFKRAFEDIMFSTRVIISQKEDFFDFLEGLIDNGFDEMALTYLEDATVLYPTDRKIRQILEKIKPVNNHHEN